MPSAATRVPAVGSALPGRSRGFSRRSERTETPVRVEIDATVSPACDS
jgi:hypothetical protein